MSQHELNRLVAALSADKEDIYARILDREVWLRWRNGELVPVTDVHKALE